MEQSGSRILRAYAKINLFLDVVRKRDDGYHEIVSLFQNISMYDRLIISKIERGIEIKSNINFSNNILYKVWEIFTREYGIPNFGLKIILEKNIPVEAGLGGGSSDAAAFLKYLGDEYGIQKEELFKLASKIGSDVPFFLEGGTAIVKGKGDEIEKLPPIKGYKVKVIATNRGISTKNAYEMLKPSLFGKAGCNVYNLYEAYQLRDLRNIQKCTYNIFEKVVLPIRSDIIANIKKLKKDYFAVSMTGSGSAVFGVSLNTGEFEFVPRGVDYEEIEL
ncbi:4-(cytidine 5'-diphospho)-2-C-methyl-D-erythritol kinase [Thermosipho atlanticus]|uniref:4-diphosphocytidyl-2-C-methyl-D-erythritol kinase n=1 Tax=Thermosipho atlanticus DSM 15807 TaxID=1123380 RepID=A0A1M5T6B0_9BACT|nr:4-(cytidine 5'-diphospho)-2-C-methyl-D-erythritol kinase [Thermosipho atlanticus]SHH46264.1 4-diphosphocytidyl-2-C-methyl-D-erythritol kinase [Thermosipho atlanticus DSM 15807]